MSTSSFTLTRRCKIAILFAVVGVLAVAALFSYASAGPDANNNIITTRHRIHNNGHRGGHGIKVRVESKPYESVGEKIIHARGGHKSLPRTKEDNPVKERNSPKTKTQQGPGTRKSVKMAANDEHFNAKTVFDLFSSCRKPDGSILIDCYSDAYGELCKLFKAFGTVFGFVSSDVLEKIEILREYLRSPDAENYETVHSMLTYEVEQSITNNKKKASGARTLLRLHRALEFIVALLIEIKDTNNNDKFSKVACRAYDDTLARHHPWLIKKAVHMAMYVLPTRADLLKKMQVDDNEAGMADLSKLIDELKIIYKITDDLFAKDNLLDLP